MRTNNNFHILIVDDEKLNIDLAAIYLKEEKYKVSFAMNAQSALEVISKSSVDLILLDINMPQVDGFRLAKLLKSDVKTEHIPIIFLTAQTTMDYITKAFEVGGVDYITKPFNGAELKARVKTQIKAIDNLIEIQDKQKKLAQLTITDPLTKLHNQLYFDSKIKAFQANQEAYWIIYIKINHFDKVNTLFGFHTANKFLRHLAKVLLKNAYKNTVIARLFGANFAVLVKDYSSEDIKKMYNPIVKDLKNDTTVNAKITIQTIFYHVDSSVAIPEIYKNILTKLEKMQDQNIDMAVL